MKRIIPIFVLTGLLILLPLGDDPEKGAAANPGDKRKKEICITFDDLPVVRIHDRIERLMVTDEILYTLEEFGIIAAGFVVGDNIESDLDILETWLAAGHTLGNHTYSHPDLNDVPHKLFIKDIKKGGDTIEEVLTAAGQKKRYFRYPSLHYGNTHNAKMAVGDFLDEEGYIVAHVSVDTDDFAYNLQFEKIYKTADSLSFVQLGNEYIDHIMERLLAAEELANELLGRPIKHILLLHANRLNSTFLADLLIEIQQEGYQFISLDKALTDPVYSIPDSYVGTKGLSCLEKLAKTDPDLLPAREGR
jgi:peptidoglycan/xylan/chitin deacetylase (PgdA/CDA1 family)